MTRNQATRIVVAILVALVGLAGTSALGFWQYSRAHRDDIAQQVLAADAVPLQSLVQPRSYLPEHGFAQRVTVADGTLETDRALLTCGRVEREMNGCWVIAPLRVSPTLDVTTVIGFTRDTEADATLARVRALSLPAASFGGRMQPGELIDRGHAILTPGTRVAAISVNELAVRWHTNMLDGYLVLDASPNVEGLQNGLTSALVLPPSGITWRNLFYAWQWWTFAGFVLLLLVRYVTDVIREPRTIAASPAEEH